MKVNRAFSDRPRYLKLGVHENHWHVLPFHAHRTDICNHHDVMHMNKIIVKTMPISWKTDFLHTFSVNSSIKGRM